MAGPKPGQTSKITYDITWKLKCKSNHCYGCPAKLNVVFINHSKTLVVEHAKGWLHKHGGESNAKQGLPPDVKLLIDDLVKKNPTMKFGGVCNVLFEQHNVSTEMRERISNYYYKGSGARNASHSALLGVSSYGCVASWVAVNGESLRYTRTCSPHSLRGSRLGGIGGGCIGSELRCLCKRPYAGMCGRQTARVSAVYSHALRDCQTLTLLSAGPTPP